MGLCLRGKFICPLSRPLHRCFDQNIPGENIPAMSPGSFMLLLYRSRLCFLRSHDVDASTLHRASKVRWACVFRRKPVGADRRQRNLIRFESCRAAAQIRSSMRGRLRCTSDRVRHRRNPETSFRVDSLWTSLSRLPMLRFDTRSHSAAAKR